MPVTDAELARSVSPEGQRPGSAPPALIKDRLGVLAAGRPFRPALEDGFARRDVDGKSARYLSSLSFERPQVTGGFGSRRMKRLLTPRMSAWPITWNPNFPYSETLRSTSVSR